MVCTAPWSPGGTGTSNLRQTEGRQDRHGNIRRSRPISPITSSPKSRIRILRAACCPRAGPCPTHHSWVAQRPQGGRAPSRRRRRNFRRRAGDEADSAGCATTSTAVASSARNALRPSRDPSAGSASRGESSARRRACRRAPRAAPARATAMPIPIPPIGQPRGMTVFWSFRVRASCKGCCARLSTTSFQS